MELHTPAVSKINKPSYYDAMPIHLTQGQDAQCRAHRLQPATQQLIQLMAIPRRKLDLKPYASTHASAVQPRMPHDKDLCWLPIHAITVLA